MRRSGIVRASVLAVALSMVIIPTVSAQPPNPGSRDIQSFANAWFTQPIGDCSEVRLHLGFAGGDDLQNPLGSGKPGSWADYSVELEAWDTCGDTQLAWFTGTGFHPEEVDGFASAIVSGTETDLYSSDGDSVHVNVDLFWTGIGDPEVTTERHDGYQRVTRTAPATVDGEIVVSAYGVWGDEPLVVTFDEGDRADLGWASEISTPVPPPCAAAPDGMTAWWPGDGNGRDIVGGFDATRAGDARFGNGIVASAFVLHGDGDALEVGNDQALDVGTGDFTVSLWVRFDATDGERTLAEQWWQGDQETPSLGWTLTKLEDDSILLAVSGPDTWEVGAQTDGGIVSPDAWYLVTARRAGSELTVFVNGEPRASAELDDSVTWDLSSPLPLTFGHRADERGFFVDGRLDEIQLFVGTAVSDAAVWSQFAAGTAGTCR